MLYIFFTGLGFALGYLLGQQKDINIRQAVSDDLEKLEIEFISQEMELADEIAEDAQDEAKAVSSMTVKEQADEISNILDFK